MRVREGLVHEAAGCCLPRSWHRESLLAPVAAEVLVSSSSSTNVRTDVAATVDSPVSRSCRRSRGRFTTARVSSVGSTSICGTCCAGTTIDSRRAYERDGVVERHVRVAKYVHMWPHSRHQPPQTGAPHDRQ